MASWLIANNVGDMEPFALDSVNGWPVTLTHALAVDMNRPADLGRRGP
jgi:hypothetical protein